MKKVITLISIFALLAVAYSPNANAQTAYQPEKITVNTSDLTPDQLAKIKAQQELETMQQKLDTYGKWVGVGGEIGIAVREGLNSVVDVADKFGKTDVGQFTLIMIAWKVMGKDIVRIVLGFIFLVAMTWLIVKVYRTTYLPKRILVENPGFMKYPKKYEIVKPDSSWDGYNFVRVFMIFLYAGTIGLTYAIMFA
jgi:hypothetical protein